jgi:ectoine hydroxylase-related dioxygenase (phytanoyl-CoA dioxygenase family)
MELISRLPSGYTDRSNLDVGVFARLCSTETLPADYPHASDIEQRVPVYDGDQVRKLLDDPAAERSLLTEWGRSIGSGPGVIAIRRGYADTSVVDAMSELFWQIIEHERAAGAAEHDHFAAAGSNTRVWNVIQKAALLDPHVALRYYSNPVVARAAEAWLGPWYRISAQVNVVHPGGPAQSPHRDYHLGFQSDDDVERFPLHVQLFNPMLTLQGAVVHSAMPVEAGPTRVLPYSQLALDGYLAWRDPRFAAYFAEHYVQLALDPGDLVFFSPGLHHAAGENRTGDHDRIANLLQISSVFAKPMEEIDSYAMAAATYPALVELAASGELDEREVACAIAAIADGYSFPSNLDTDPPRYGHAPETAQHLMARALGERWAAERFRDELLAHRLRRRA